VIFGEGLEPIGCCFSLGLWAFGGLCFDGVLAVS
jgi:hypothetical protein